MLFNCVFKGFSKYTGKTGFFQSDLASLLNWVGRFNWSEAVVSGRKRSYSVIIPKKNFGHFWPFWLSPGVPGADPEGPLGPTPLGGVLGLFGGGPLGRPRGTEVSPSRGRGERAAAYDVWGSFRV